MTDRFEDLEGQLQSISRDLRRVETRLDRLETRLGLGLVEATPEPVAVPAGAGGLSVTREVSQGTLALAGRTLVALGGGYLIRAMTDAGALPALAGVVLGLAYGVSWLAHADRAAHAGRRDSAAFSGLTSGLLAYPLLWETTTRFGLLSPPVALAILVLLFGVGIAVATRHHLGSVAWVIASLALGTTAGLLFSTRYLLAAVLALLAIGSLVEWLAFRDLWLDLRWPTALVLDAALVALVLVGSRPGGLPEGYPALPTGAAVTATLGLTALYAASIVARTLGRGCPVTPFEVAQGAAALGLGLGGAWAILAARGGTTTTLGGLGLLLGALSYAAAFAFVERRTGHGRNFYFYSTLGCLLALVGSRAILGRAALGFVWCLLALASAWLGRRFARMTLRFHAALYLGAATLMADLLAASSRELFAPAASWPLPELAGWITLAAALAAYSILASERAPSLRFWERLPQGLMAALAVWVAGGTLVATLVAVLGPAWASDPAIVATLRTGVLALLAVVLAGAARGWTLPELAWLVYPLLAIGGLKLITEDLRLGRPATLFVSLVLYGGALIAAPRLMRRSA